MPRFLSLTLQTSDNEYLNPKKFIFSFEFSLIFFFIFSSNRIIESFVLNYCRNTLAEEEEESAASSSVEIKLTTTTKTTKTRTQVCLREKRWNQKNVQDAFMIPRFSKLNSLIVIVILTVYSLVFSFAFNILFI